MDSKELYRGGTGDSLSVHLDERGVIGNVAFRVEVYEYGFGWL